MRVSPRVSLGIFSVFFGLGLFILLRGDINDTYSGILVCCIALIQLFEYGFLHKMDCYPGSSNDKATRGIYLLLWLMPSILCFSAAFFANHNLLGDANTTKSLLMGVGAVYLLIFIVFAMVVYKDRNTWCSVPGNMWQPNYGFLHSEYVPMQPNILLFAGLLLPTLLVDPNMLGIGTITIVTTGLFLGRKFDPYLKGEWLSVTTLFSNLIGIWALFIPPLRRDILGISPTY